MTQAANSALRQMVYADLHAKYERSDRQVDTRRTEATGSRVRHDGRQHRGAGCSCTPPGPHRQSTSRRAATRRDVVARCRSRVMSSISVLGSPRGARPATSIQSSSSPRTDPRCRTHGHSGRSADEHASELSLGGDDRARFQERSHRNLRGTVPTRTSRVPPASRRHTGQHRSARAVSDSRNHRGHPRSPLTVADPRDGIAVSGRGPPVRCSCRRQPDGEDDHRNRRYTWTSSG